MNTTPTVISFPGARPVIALAAAVLIALSGGVAMAQDEPQPTKEKAPAKAAGTLKVGDAAPALSVEKWVKGEPITGLEKGKVYVVEFWATWCGPCVASMPHLSELQREHKDKGVTICGVNVWEDNEYNSDTLAKAEKFVADKGDGMAYSVAFDGAAKFMDAAWMKAAGREGIPCAFVVDRTGSIAWIGHPARLDMVLDEVLAGTWDIAGGPARLKAAANAFVDAGAKYKDSLAAGDAAWADAIKQYPAMGRTKAAERFAAMLEARHFTQAYALGNQIVDSAKIARNAAPIMEIFLAIANPQQRPEVFDTELLLKAAQANFDLSNPHDAGPHVIMAHAYFAAGDADKARASANKALELTKPEVRPNMEARLKKIEEDSKTRAMRGPR